MIGNLCPESSLNETKRINYKKELKKGEGAIAPELISEGNH
jgi:hypothetical protein